MLMLECPRCQSCFMAEEWNKQPRIGEAIPLEFEYEGEWQLWLHDNTGNRVDCPDCEDVVLYEDMMSV